MYRLIDRNPLWGTHKGFEILFIYNVKSKVNVCVLKKIKGENQSKMSREKIKEAVVNPRFKNPDLISDAYSEEIEN